MLPIFSIPLLVGVTIQAFKIIIDFIQEKKFEIKNIWRAGGFPSVHSGISTSVATIMFLIHGYQSSEFAITVVFAFLFWYDAMNIRYEAGKHAKYINKISIELKNTLNVGEVHLSLKERLGHTFFEVIWGIVFGFGLSYFYYLIFLK